MRLRRRIKVFVSYNSEDHVLIEALIKWLRQHGCEPLFYTGGIGIAVGESLPRWVTQMIDESDALLSVGTSRSLVSPWCRLEAVYARSKGKKYLPVLCERMERSRIASWFLSMGGEEVRYAECLAGNFTSLTEAVKGLGIRAPLRLSFTVLLLFLFLIGIPIFASWAIRQRIGLADREIRDLQSWVEGLNRDLAEGRKYQVRCTGSSIDYRDPETGELVARDSDLNGGIKRLFFRAGHEVANDKVVFKKTSGYRPSLSKKREIYPEGRGILVEETFDSIGKLVMKRVKRSGRSGLMTYSYSDVGVSLYPIIPFCPYR